MLRQLVLRKKIPALLLAMQQQQIERLADEQQKLGRQERGSILDPTEVMPTAKDGEVVEGV